MKMPVSEATTRSNYILPNNANNILWMSDIHVPYHNEKAIELALDYGKDEKINTIFLGGDIMDFYQISRFDKNPTLTSLKQEFEDTRQLFAYLRYRFPDALIYFKLGNHEIRWEKFLMKKAPQLFDMAEFKLDVILRFAEYKINLAGPPMGFVEAGKLFILHGHEFSGGAYSPVNPAKGFFNKTGISVIAGHHHRSSTHTSKQLDNKLITTYSTSCFCELRPDFMPINDWRHGGAIIKIKPSGNFKVNLFDIIDGDIV